MWGCINKRTFFCWCISLCVVQIFTYQSSHMVPWCPEFADRDWWMAACHFAYTTKPLLSSDCSATHSVTHASHHLVCQLRNSKTHCISSKSSWISSNHWLRLALILHHSMRRARHAVSNKNRSNHWQLTILKPVTIVRRNSVYMPNPWHDCCALSATSKVPHWPKVRHLQWLQFALPAYMV